MSFTPISNTFIQYSATSSGTSASSYFLKLYAAGTTTPISTALDSAGSTLVAKVELDSLGFAQNGSGGATTLYIDQSYRLVLYVNATDADNNTFSNAVQDIDNIPTLVTGSGQANNVLDRPTLNAAVIDTSLQAGLSINIAERTDGDGGGGMWDVVLSSTVTVNTFDIVQCTGVPTLSLVLRLDLPVVVDKFGAKGDGTTDSTAVMDEDNFTRSSEIRLGDGVFLMNTSMQLRSLKGNGYSTEIRQFSPTTNDGYPISLGKHSLPYGAFDFQWVRDLAIEGLTTGCIRFDDPVDEDGNDLSSGGWLLENLTLRAREGAGGGDSKCIKVEFGSIGNKFNNINGTGCDYHYWLQNNQFSVQHTGANTWTANHLQRADKASIYLSDAQQGRGGWAFNDMILENNAGFGFFCIAPTDSNIVNHGALVLNNVWLEKNGVMVTGAPDLVTMVNIDGTEYLPQDMRFESFGNIVINASTVKSMDVIQSDVACYDCRHDGDNGYYNVTKDKDSTINITNPSGANTFSIVDLWSHTAPATISGYFNNRSPFLRMAHRSVRAAATRRTSNSQGLEKTVGGNYTFTAGMTGAQVADGLIYDTCLETTTIANQGIGAAVIQQTATNVGGIDGLSPGAITLVSQAGNAVVVVTAHGFEDNQLISIDGVVGMTEVNGREFYINKIDANNFSLRGEDSTGYAAYISGGTATAISSYAVMTVACKVMSGKDNITSIRWDNSSTGGVGNIRHGAIEEWVTTVCMINMSASGIGFSNAGVNVITNAGGSAVIRFADFQVAAFPTKQEASDFIHSGIFEYTP